MEREVKSLPIRFMDINERGDNKNLIKSMLQMMILSSLPVLYFNWISFQKPEMKIISNGGIKMVIVVANILQLTT